MNKQVVVRGAVCCIILCIALFAGSSNGASVVSADYRVNSLKLLELEVEVALINVTFDDDIYIASAINCLPSVGTGHDCTSLVNVDCPPCDYTLLNGNCGVSTDGCPPCDPTFCNQTLYQWVDIKSGDKLPANVPASTASTYGVLQFRYYNNKPCDGFRLKPDAKFLSTAVMTSWYGPNDVWAASPAGFGDRAAQVPSYSVELNYCPYDQDWGYFQMGTLFISVFNLEAEDNEAFISIDSAPIDQAITNTDPAPAPYDEYHTPMQDGHAYYRVFDDGDLDQAFNFTFTISQCEVIAIRLALPNSTLDADYMVSDDPSNPSPVYSGSWMGSRNGEDYGVMSLCPEPGQASKTLFIVVIAYYRVQATPFRIGITTQAPRLLQGLTDFFPLTTELSLRPAAALILPSNPNKLLACVHPSRSCTEFYGIYPSPLPNVFFELPQSLLTFIDLYHLNIVTNSIVPPPGGSRTLLQMALLHYEYPGAVGTPINATEFPMGTMRFKGILVNKDYAPVIADINYKPAEQECVFSEYIDVLSLQHAQLQLIQSAVGDDVVQARMNADLYTQFNAWSECQSYAEQYYSQQQTTVDIISDDCLVENDDDPCCNVALKYTLCCYPHPQTTTVSAYAGQLNDDVIGSECARPSCTDGIVESFATSISNLDSCASPQLEETQNMQMIYDVVRACSSVVDGSNYIPCTSDDVCASTYPGGFCDYARRVCDFPAAYYDIGYSKCVIANISGVVKTSFLAYIGADAHASLEVQAQALVSLFTDYDCVLNGSGRLDMPQIGPQRSFWGFYSSPQECLDDYSWIGCEMQYCKDDSCQVPTDFCSLVCFREWAFIAGDPGYCSISFYYPYDVLSICNAADCTGLPSANCSALCDAAGPEYCGVCLNKVYCPELPGIDATACSSALGCLLPDGSVISVSDADTCTNDNGVCSDPTITDQATCVTNGVCSDAEVLQPGWDGACVMPALIFAGSESPVCYYARWTNFGCVDDTVINAHNCSLAGGEWYTPAQTQEECESYFGCYDNDQINVNIVLDFNYNPRFTGKDKGNCTACGKKWINYFAWSTNTWIAGIPMKPQVLTPVSGPQYLWEPAFSYYAVLESLSEVVDNITASAYQTEAECRFNKVQNSLTNIVCDCTAGGRANGTCYSASPESLDILVRACAGGAVEYSTVSVDLSFPIDSVAEGCTQILLYDITISVFQTPQPVRLASYFASFQNIPANSITNSDGGQIGQVLTDGVDLVADGAASNFELCFTISPQHTAEGYDVYDFGSYEGDDYKTFTPYNLSPTFSNNQLCAIVSVKPGSTKYIPIKRLSDWQNVKAVYFTPTSRALLITLGVLYVVLSAFAFFLIVCVAAFTFMGKIKKFLFTNVITFTIFAFTLIRCVYFFLVPTGALSVNGSVAEYILIIFPTFPYFTAFSCVPLVWAIVSTGPAKTGGANDRIFKAVGVLNAILYVLFIVIVVVFSETKKIDSNVCLGSITQATQLTTPQNAVSLVYSVVISFISLLIAISFIFFGRRVAVISQSDTITAKTYKMVVVCAIGFILNCLFILIITGAKLNNVGFSFAGLIISEIIPSIFMLLNFGSFQLVIDLITGKSSASTSSSMRTSTTSGTSSSKSSASRTITASSSQSGDSSSTLDDV